MKALKNKRVIEETIFNCQLDLSNKIVYTEAASGNFVVTPIIAALAGAKVFAITRDSKYASAKSVMNLTYDFARFCGVRDRIEVVFETSKEYIGQADIVTNLGFVRPINSDFIALMKKGSVILYMCEDWEYRKEDVDLIACKRKNIPVLFTNEGNIFNYCGLLCAKMLFEAGVEIYNNAILVVSDNKFGIVLVKWLSLMGADVSLRTSKNVVVKQNFDAVVIAHTDNVHFDQETTYPIIKFSEGIRMVKTLAYLGVRPVIELHTLGLKIGQ